MLFAKPSVKGANCSASHAETKLGLRKNDIQDLELASRSGQRYAAPTQVTQKQNDDAGLARIIMQRMSMLIFASSHLRNFLRFLGQDPRVVRSTESTLWGTMSPTMFAGPLFSNKQKTGCRATFGRITTVKW